MVDFLWSRYCDVVLGHSIRNCRYRSCPHHRRYEGQMGGEMRFLNSQLDSLYQSLPPDGIDSRVSNRSQSRVHRSQGAQLQAAVLRVAIQLQNHSRQRRSDAVLFGQQLLRLHKPVHSSVHVDRLFCEDLRHRRGGDEMSRIHTVSISCLKNNYVLIVCSVDASAHARLEVHSLGRRCCCVSVEQCEDRIGYEDN